MKIHTYGTLERVYKQVKKHVTHSKENHSVTCLDLLPNSFVFEYLREKYNINGFSSIQLSQVSHLPVCLIPEIVPLQSYEDRIIENKISWSGKQKRREKRQQKRISIFK